ncbi:MAG: DUF2079 domain-containing protein [Ktedonobacterales bacterium]|nr:DUF2079 domain-containing protein [Ktedonobacterales bacterium]
MGVFLASRAHGLPAFVVASVARRVSLSWKGTSHRLQRGIAHQWRRRPLSFTIGLLIITLGALAYVVLWSAYLFQKHDALRTGAEDLGIMDQVIWNTAHGRLMYESICNAVSDVNCLAGTMRFAIHFEPILIPLSVLYRFFPTPKTLLFLQVLVVATSVYPTYLLAVYRLRHAAWGVAFAALFLLSPAVQSAVIDDFHPEALAAPLMLWALYFLATRRDLGLIIVCVVALLTKETLALEVASLGGYIALGQRRWRLGFGLAALGTLTLVLALVIMHLSSPIGRSPVVTRFDPLLDAPVPVLLAILGDPARHTYLIQLFAQTGFLALLSPWMVAVALPSIAVNLLSANPMMYSGAAQYNIALAPFLIVGAIDGLAWLTPLLTRLLRRLAHLARSQAPRLRGWAVSAPLVASLLLAGVWGLGFQNAVARDYTQYGEQGAWPATTPHIRLGQRLLTAIPPTASVSAEAGLVPHLSERVDIYQFPSGADTAEYVFLDVTTGTFYPFINANEYIAAFHRLLTSGDFTMLAAQDGYLLLRRLPPTVRATLSRPLPLPASFFTFLSATPPSAATALLVRHLADVPPAHDGINASPHNTPAHPSCRYWRACG